MTTLIKRFLPSTRRRTWLRSLSLGIAIVCFLCLGIGLSQALASEKGAATVAQTPSVTAGPEGAFEPVTHEFQLGQDFYLESCSACHIAVPPAVLPQQTWRVLLTDPNHYGIQIEPLPRFNARLVIDYLSIYSRPRHNQRVLPFRLSESAYFQALHPNLEFPQAPTLTTCISCHPSAEAFNFRDWTEGF
ncbi:MAG: diheme cytochrome C [Cyanobacteria bacterium P01_G01_bin.38]